MGRLDRPGASFGGPRPVTVASCHDGKVYVVTGAASGIGAGTIARLASAGALMVAVDRDEVAADSALAFRFDVADEHGWQDAAAQVLARFGRIDGLVNCAGVIRMAAITAMPLADFQLVMRVNVEGTFLGMKHIMPAMLAAGHGSIVNISSTAGIAGAAHAGAYCASKGAVRMLTKSAALEAISHPSAVRVNSIHPAMTETPMVQEIVQQLGGGSEIEVQMRELQPSGRFIPVDSVVDGIAFLLSDSSLHINGSELVIDNGFTAA
jgi:NAD(P)-dependent dehydrogenase (short-subunit alcohol dehydrogenase family)